LIRRSIDARQPSDDIHQRGIGRYYNLGIAGEGCFHCLQLAQQLRIAFEVEVCRLITSLIAWASPSATNTLACI